MSVQQLYGSRCSIHEARAVRYPARFGGRTDGQSSQRSPAVIAGTWDFKWPVGTRLRVAFQLLPDDAAGVDYSAGRRLVIEKLDAWLLGRRSEGIPAPNLSYEVVGELPPPAYVDHGKRIATSLKGGSFVDYDVLVSFVPLPVYLPATTTHPKEELVGTSASELGRYAQRIEYGVPTVYVGPQFGADPATWFSSPDGIFAVVHELGHVLGMPHEQQNPTAPKLPWKSLEDMLAIVRGRPGLSPEMDPKLFVEEEVVAPWRGELMFSDWRPRAGLTAPYDFDSAMAKPSYRCLLEGVHDEAVCSTSGCSIADRDTAALSQPTSSDLEHLITMYGEAEVILSAVDSPTSSGRAAAE